MKKLLILLLFPLMMFAQDSTLIGDVDCDGFITSQDASLIMQWIAGTLDQDDDGVTDEDQSVIQTVLPCPENMIGLTPEQLQEMIGKQVRTLIWIKLQTKPNPNIRLESIPGAYGMRTARTA